MSAELISKSKYQLGLSLLSKYPFCCIFFCKQDLKAVEAASRQEFSCHCFLGSASLPNRTLKVQKTSASLLCFHRGAQKAQKKITSNAKFIHLKLDIKWWEKWWVFYTESSSHGPVSMALCKLKKEWLAQDAAQSSSGLPCSSSPGSAALQACQTVFSFPKLEVVCANSRFPG